MPNTALQIVPTNTSTSVLDKKFKNLIDSSNIWQCEFIFNEAEKPEDPPVLVDLGKILFEEKEKYTFPDHYNGEKDFDRLKVALEMASIKSGFSLIQRSRKSSKQLEQRNSNYKDYAIFGCQSCLLYQPAADNKKGVGTSTTCAKKRKTSSKRQTARKNLCRFRLILYRVACPGFPSKWCLKATKDNNGWHSGHPRMQPSHLTVSIRKMTAEQKQLALQCSQLCFSTSSNAALLNLRNELGITYSDEQIRYLTRTEQNNVNKLSEDASSADQLIESFKKRSDVAFLTVCYSPTEGLIMSMSQKDKKNLERDIYLNRVRCTETELKHRTELENLYRTSVVSSEGQEQGSSEKKLLLIFMFATNDELRLKRLFPEFTACDTTFGTNREKKEMFTLASIDSNNHGFNCGRAFIPSAQGWVFRVLFRYCLKLFWGEGLCSKLGLMISDGNREQYGSFIDEIGPTGTYPNATLGLCRFHLINQSFNKHVKGVLTTDDKTREASKIVLRFLDPEGVQGW